MTFDLVKVLSRSKSNQPSMSEHGSHGEGSHAEHHKSKPVPFLASPVDPEALLWLEKKKRHAQGVGRSTTVAAFEAEARESELAGRLFRKQHEASTLELFFDLFFVANLAVFTTLSAHVDLQSLSNYVGFFAILWTTWFHISMYDVRFYVDCIFTRIGKFLCFGIMVSFVGLTTLYDSILGKTQTRSFVGIALLMFAARILWAIQYAVVLFYVRVFDKTLVPMLLTISVYVCTSIGFLVTYIQERNNTNLNGAEGAVHVRIWYGIICAEAVAIIVISCIWRILSFKHTHLVERVGLLTLIIMGEGIIGLVKSTSYAVQGSTVSFTTETVIVGFAVLLIYLIYILYFDNIDHHRFGTIRQQIWTLLHFPFHLAILLTVEGSTALLVWNSCRGAISWIKDRLPTQANPKGTFTDQASWLANLNNTYNEAQVRYHYKSLEDYYNFTTDYTKLSKPKNTFGTAAWADEVKPILKKMTSYYEYFVYQNFGAEGPKYKLKKATDYGVKVEEYENGFKFVLCYFYGAAGGLLLLLAFLYWFGRTRKTKTEWASVAIRLLGGMCLPIALVSPLTEVPGQDISFRFSYSFLIIPIVAVAYLLVIIVDNIVKAIADKHYTVVEARRLSRLPTQEEVPKAAHVTVQEQGHYTDQDSSYEMHSKSDFRSPQQAHGSPQVVHGDSASLVENAQRTPTGGWEEQTRGHRSGYSQVSQADEEISEYRGGQVMNRYRTQDKSQY